MHVAIPLDPGYTALDAVSPYTVLAFAPGWTVTFVAAEPGPVLDDRRGLSLHATASFAELPRPEVLLAHVGAEPGRERVVTDGKIVTAAGVSSGIDMALTLLAQASGATTAQTVQLAIEYAPEPPFEAGSPTTAPAELREPALPSRDQGE